MEQQAQRTNWPDIMVDLETTGTNKAGNAIIQIAAVKFDLMAMEIGPSFDRCLLLAPNRFWDEDCRVNFWGKRIPVLEGIMARMEQPLDVLVAFRDWVNPSNGSRLWGKPTHFDYAFLESYYTQFGMQIPFFYRHANDMNSWLRGRFFPSDPPDLERIIPFVGDAHNGLHDCLHQIKVLLAAKAMSDQQIVVVS